MVAFEDLSIDSEFEEPGNGQARRPSLPAEHQRRTHCLRKPKFRAVGSVVAPPGKA